ncbi:hypothetical protein [Gimesia aquarii]|uniref:DUF3592 domain-containing protein n=1 Tax=Gimesia aquarii TaxID=2527964 RepID=A0A517VYY4_9PLAN|nr:hypothetical protein [Gimesia aquarii]QDT98225.1 hypothetical protein V144x_37110 [Gimesia aquarii]
MRPEFVRISPAERNTPKRDLKKLISMDEEEELSKLKWLLIAVVVFLVSGFFSYQELKYAVWSTTTEADVTRTYTTEVSSGRRFRRHRKKVLAVEYTFTDKDGNHHSERDDIPISAPIPGPKVTIQYFSGVENSSRIKGYSRKLAVWIFLGCCVWLGYAGFKLYRLASEAVDGKPRRRRR